MGQKIPDIFCRRLNLCPLFPSNSSKSCLLTLNREISDDQIIALLNQSAQQEQGFRLLMAKYQERLYRHIRRLVIDHEDANDVLQNCLIKAFRAIDRFEGKSGLYTWLYRIASNEAFTFLERKKRKMAASIDGEDQLAAANRLRADSYFNGDEAQALLHRALTGLPDKQREVFTLRYFEDMGYQEMSDMLGTSVGALKASYHHAVKKIEQFFKNEQIR